MGNFRKEPYMPGLCNRELRTEHGDAEALYALGLRYAMGKEGFIDYVSAHKWLNLAAMSGLGRAAADRAELAREMSPAQISDAQRAAREWLQTRR